MLKFLTNTVSVKATNKFATTCLRAKQIIH